MQFCVSSYHVSQVRVGSVFSIDRCCSEWEKLSWNVNAKFNHVSPKQKVKSSAPSGCTHSDSPPGGAEGTLVVICIDCCIFTHILTFQIPKKSNTVAASVNKKKKIFIILSRWFYCHSMHKIPPWHILFYLYIFFLFFYLYTISVFQKSGVTKKTQAQNF